MLAWYPVIVSPNTGVRKACLNRSNIRFSRKISPSFRTESPKFISLNLPVLNCATTCSSDSSRTALVHSIASDGSGMLAGKSVLSRAAVGSSVRVVFAGDPVCVFV